MLGLGLALAHAPSNGSAKNPLSTYEFAYNFVTQTYWQGGTPKASLAAVSGYSFTDNVDNQPNIAANGFTPLVSEISVLRMNARSSGAAAPDVDLMMWATVTPPTANTGVQRWVLEICDGTNNNRISVLLGADGLAIGQVVSGGVVEINSGASVFATDATPITLLVRNLSGTVAIGAVKGGVLTWGSSSVNFPAGMTQCRIGNWVNGGGNQTNAPISKAHLKLATYANDAAVLAAIAGV